MREFVREGKLESSVQLADPDGRIWQHFKIPYRGSWAFVTSDGGVKRRVALHSMPEVRKELEKLVA